MTKRFLTVVAGAAACLALTAAQASAAVLVHMT